MRKRSSGTGQNPLCLHCFEKLRPVDSIDGTVVFEVKSGQLHTCGRYREGKYRPAKEARIYHKARLEALEDDPTQPEDTESQKYGSDVLGALRASLRRSQGR